MDKPRSIAITTGMLLCCASATARAGTLRVDDDAGPGGDGSAAAPFADLQAAIAAADPGDDVLVAAGSYAAISIAGKQLHVAGGYDAAFTGASPDTPSIIEGDADTPSVTLFEVGDTVLEGFVIRGGAQGVVIDADYLSTTNKPTLRDNVIETNGSPAVIGGGVSAIHCELTLIGNTVRDNVGDRGSGIATQCTRLLVEDNTIEGNVSHGDHGGGLYLNGPDITVRGNLVRDNEVGVVATYGWGGGAIVYGEGTTAAFERNVFTGNHAESLGSGLFVDDGAIATVTGDLFHANDCGVEGGAGVFVDGYDTTPSRATLVNVTIAGHDCDGIEGAAVEAQTYSVVEIRDSIVWGNGGDDFSADPTSMISAAYSLTEEPLEGEGNLSGDPLFADPDAGDFHVRSRIGRFDPGTSTFVVDDVDSPTIDAGDPSAAWALEPGPNGMRVNLGHTGNSAEASMGGPGGTPSDGADGSGSDGGSGDDGSSTDTVDGASTGDGGTSEGSPPEDGTTMVGCGCAQGGSGGWLGLAFAALGRLRRRRRK